MLESDYVRAGTWVRFWLGSFCGFNYFLFNYGDMQL